MTVDELVAKALEDKASDVHLVRGLTPRYRVDGAIREMDAGILTAQECEDMARELAGRNLPRPVWWGRPTWPCSSPGCGAG